MRFTSVWGGANDIFFQLGARRGRRDHAGAIAGERRRRRRRPRAAGRRSCEAAGARNIIVFNLPDIGRTPFGVASGQGAQISAISGPLQQHADRRARRARRADDARQHLRALQRSRSPIRRRSASSNVTTPACGATPSLLCTSANLVTPDAASTFVFADGVHPTTAGTRGDRAGRRVDDRGPGANRRARRSAARRRAGDVPLDRRADDRPASTRRARPSKLDAWVSYDYGHNDFDGRFLSGNADVNTVAAGGDIKVSDRLLDRRRVRLLGQQGRLRRRQRRLQAQGNDGHRLRRLRRRARGTSARRSARAISISATSIATSSSARCTRTESGETRGWHAMASVLGGYWFTYNDWLHGPFARLAYQEIHVQGLRRERQRQHGAVVRRAGAEVASSRASAGRSPAASRTCGRSRASRGRSKARTTIASCRRRRSRSAAAIRSPSSSPTTTTCNTCSA